jgi:hypothetical protein
MIEGALKMMFSIFISLRDLSRSAVPNGNKPAAAVEQIAKLV